MHSVSMTFMRFPTLLLRASLLLCAACGDEHEPSRDGGGDAVSAASDARTAETQVSDARVGTHDAAANGPVDAGAAPAIKNDASQVAAEVRDAATPSSDGGAAGACGACTTYAPAVQKGQIGERDLAELSGLTVGHKNTDVVFAHNDRMRTTVYGLGFDGKLRATITLDRAVATDPEDIAVGPCPEGTCLFLADIGDNAASRREYAILRFAEPMLSARAEPQNLTVTAQRFTFAYEDGSHNAEGFMVSSTGRLYVVTKGTGPSSVYRLPETLQVDNNIATKVATLTVPAASDMAASAAAAHPCGLGFLLRTYDKIYEFRATGSDFESAFQALPKVVAMPSEPQSEGISYLADGRGFLSSGEGASAPIFGVSCQ